MSRLGEWYQQISHRFSSANHLIWLISSLGLIGLYFLARRVEPSSLAVFKQLIVLYSINSGLFFFVDRSHAKMGTLTLIFLITMELFVILFYALAIYSRTTF